jgi:hypothetical protein
MYGDGTGPEEGSTAGVGEVLLGLIGQGLPHESLHYKQIITVDYRKAFVSE